MLPISELVRVARSVDEGGSSPLAVHAARAWGYDRVRFLRSSANHVFVCEGGGRPTGVLRLRPDEPGAAEAAQRVAELVNRLAAAGISVSPALSSLDGRLVANVRTGSTRFVAAMFSASAGEQVDAESLTPGRAWSWGQGLARMHDAATRLDPCPVVPSWVERVKNASRAMATQRVREAAAEIVDALRRLPKSGEVVGVVHGDAELDNVIWETPDEPRFVDFDDLSRSWFAADIGFALRDFTTLGGILSGCSSLVDSFIGGYRECRSLADEELAWLPLFRRAHAVVMLAGLERVLAEPVAGDWPPWANQLHTRVQDVAAKLRSLVALRSS